MDLLSETVNRYFSTAWITTYSSVQRSPVGRAPEHPATSPQPRTVLKIPLALVQSRSVLAPPVPPPAVFDFRRWLWRVWSPRRLEDRRWKTLRRRSGRGRRHAALRIFQSTTDTDCYSSSQKRNKTFQRLQLQLIIYACLMLIYTHFKFGFS